MNPQFDLHAHECRQIFDHAEFNLIECFLGALNYSERVLSALCMRMCLCRESDNHSIHHISDIYINSVISKKFFNDNDVIALFHHLDE